MAAPSPEPDTAGPTRPSAPGEGSARDALLARATRLPRTLLDRLFPRGALLLSVLTFISYAMGLVRDRIFARTYGAGSELDAYNAAFVLPELTLDVLVASGLAAPFIPILARVGRENAEAAEAFARTVTTVVVLVMAVAAIVLFVAAPATVSVIAPGFDAAERVLYTDLFRLMAVTPVIFAASIALGELLIANHRFLFYGLAPILYNVGIALGTVLLADRIGIFAAAVGAVLGAVLHLAIRIVGIARTSFRYRPSLHVRTAAFAEFVRLMVPKMLSHPVEPVTFLFFTAIASGLADGSVSAVSFARNFQSVPVSLIGVSFSLAVFPTLSAAYAAGDRAGFVRVLRTNVLTIGGLTIAAAIALYAVAGIAIQVLLGGGAFDAEDVAMTSLVLGAFALSVPFDALAHPLARAMYATHNTVLQVIASLAGLAVIVLATNVLLPSAGIAAIPLGFAAGAATKAGLLAVFLVPRIRRISPATAGALPR